MPQMLIITSNTPPRRIPFLTSIKPTIFIVGIITALGRHVLGSNAVKYAEWQLFCGGELAF